MAYTLRYWHDDGEPEAYYELKHIRLKSIEESFPLALPHNRPIGTALITVERHRNYKGKQWISEKIVWEKTMDYPRNVIVNPKRTKK